MADDVMRTVAVELQLPPPLWLICGCRWSSCHEDYGANVETLSDIIQHSDSFDQEMAEGSDDDLGMDTNYDYDSDSSVEGIIQ